MPKGSRASSDVELERRKPELWKIKKSILEDPVDIVRPDTAPNRPVSDDQVEKAARSMEAMKQLFEESVARNKLEETIKDLENENQKQRNVIERERMANKKKAEEAAAEYKDAVLDITSQLNAKVELIKSLESEKVKIEENLTDAISTADATKTGQNEELEKERARREELAVVMEQLNAEIARVEKELDVKGEIAEEERKKFQSTIRDHEKTIEELQTKHKEYSETIEKASADNSKSLVDLQRILDGIQKDHADELAKRDDSAQNQTKQIEELTKQLHTVATERGEELSGITDKLRISKEAEEATKRKLDTTLKDHEAVLSQKEKRIEKLMFDTTRYLDQVRDLEGKGVAEQESFSKLTRQLKELRKLQEEDVSRHSEEVSRLQAAVKQHTAETERLNEENAVAKQSLQDENRNISAIVEKLQDEIKGLQQNLEDVNRNTAAEVTKNTEVFDELKEESARLKNQLVSAQETAKSEQAKSIELVEKLQTELKQSFEEHSSLNYSKQQELDTLKEIVEKLQDEVKLTKQEKADLESQNSGHLGDIQRKTEQVSAALEEARNSAAALTAKEEKVETLMSEVSKMLGERAALEAERDKALAAAKEAERGALDLKNSLAVLELEQKSAKSLTAEIEKLRKECASLEDERDTALSSAEDARKGRADLQRSIETYEKERKSAEALSAELEKLRDGYARLKNDKVTALASAKEAEQTIADLRRSVEAFEQDRQVASEVTAEVEKLRKEKTALAGERDKALAAAEEAERGVAGMQKALEAFEEEQKASDSKSQSALSKTREELQSTLEKHAIEIENLSSSHTEALSKLSGQLSGSESKQRELLESAQKGHHDEVNVLKSSHEQKVGELMEKLAELEATYKEYRNKSAHEQNEATQKLKAEHESVLENLRLSHVSTQDDWETQRSSALKERDAALREKSEIEETYKELLDGQNEEFQRLKDDLDRCYRLELLELKAHLPSMRFCYQCVANRLHRRSRLSAGFLKRTPPGPHLTTTKRTHPPKNPT